MTNTPTAAPELTADELAGLADLAAALRFHAALPGVLITLNPGLGDNAEASVSRCSSTARIDLGPDLLTSSQPLYGVLAHEIAHHALDHGHDTVIQRYRVAMAKTALLVGLALRLPFALLVVLAVGVVVAHLVAARRSRLQEYDADAYAVRLLDASGLAGRRIMTAALADLPADPIGYQLGGWVFGGHPTARARRRTLAAGHPARRLRWALLWQHTITPAAARYGLAASRRTEAGR